MNIVATCIIVAATVIIVLNGDSGAFLCYHGLRHRHQLCVLCN